MQSQQSRDEVFASEINYDAIEHHNIIEQKVRPWVAKKIKEYLGVEEEAMIRLVLNHITNRHSAQALFDKVAPILDDLAESFVLKLWQVVLFEQEKIIKGVYEMQETLNKMN